MIRFENRKNRILTPIFAVNNVYFMYVNIGFKTTAKCVVKARCVHFLEFLRGAVPLFYFRNLYLIFFFQAKILSAIYQRICNTLP